MIKTLKFYYYVVNPEKFRSNSRKGVFLGYDEDSTGYRIFHIDKMKIYVKRVVKFLENQPGNFNFDYVSEARRYENEETEMQDEDTLMNNLEERNYYNRNDIINIIQENKEIEGDPQEENNEKNRSQRDNNNERTVKEDIVNLDMQDIPNNSNNDINKDKEEESLSLSQKEKEHLENKFKLIEEKLENINTLIKHGNTKTNTLSLGEAKQKEKLEESSTSKQNYNEENNIKNNINIINERNKLINNNSEVILNRNVNEDIYFNKGKGESINGEKVSIINKNKDKGKEILELDDYDKEEITIINKNNENDAFNLKENIIIEDNSNKNILIENNLNKNLVENT